MTNPAPYIREKLVALLNNTITYSGVQVPCYSGEGEETAYQIILQGQAKTSQQNRDAFIWKCKQRIEVISEQPTNIHEHVDQIGNEVIGILVPTVKTTSFIGNSEFQILNVSIDIDDYIDEPSGEGTYINRLPLQINFLVTQINSN